MTEDALPNPAAAAAAVAGHPTNRVATESPAERRLVTLDAFRCMAAIAVVLIHSAEADSTVRLSHAARFAVPFFFATGGYFAVGSERSGRGFAAYVAGRARRLYLPFLAFAAGYYLVRYAAHLAVPARPAPYTNINLLADSPTQHLWCLPGLLAASVAVFSLARVMRRAHFPSSRSALTYALLSLAATAVVRIPPPPLFPYTAEMTWECVPALLTGAAISITTANRVQPRSSRAIGYAAVAVFFACLAWLVWADRNRAVENAAGAALLVAGLVLPPGKIARSLARWGAMAFGVYLVHVLFVEAAQDAMNLAKTKASLARDLSIMTFGVLASTAVVTLMSKSRWTRWMIAAGG